MLQEKYHGQMDALAQDPFSQLVEKAQAGDRRALNELTEKAKPIVSAYIGSLIKTREIQIEQAIEVLPPAQREVMRLYTLEELSLREIAAKIGRSVGTVKANLH